MSTSDPILRRFARVTAARALPLARVRRRLFGTLPTDAELRDTLDALPTADPLAVQRVRARLRAHRPAPERALLGGVRLVGAALLAAALLLALRAAVPRPLAETLASEAAWSDLAPTGDVQLAYRGTGALGGHALAPVLDWEGGTVHVEVEPDRGIALAVRTREGEVRVIGTGFDVTRDALGTAVRVRHGKVAVDCVDGSRALLVGGETHLCRPTSAAGLLGRALALLDASADDAEVLATAEAGLAAGATGPTRGELALLRVEALARLGRPADAWRAAEATLAEAPLRVDDLRRLAARNALEAAGCGAALPHLAALVDAGATGPELVLFADCVAPTDPAAARRALTAALRGGAPASHEAAIVERLTRLPHTTEAAP